MINGKKWFAFFSHTGTEIVNLSKSLGVSPDCIVTNNSPNCKDINKGITKLKSEIQWVTQTPSVSDYDTILRDCRGDCIVTLHGWMRIIPKSICRDYEIYNLHPGLITEYPDLKGKDPQARVNQEIHDKIGVVIHKVIPEVDEGEIIAESSTSNVYNGVTTITEVLHDMAFRTWKAFFDNYESI